MEPKNAMVSHMWHAYLALEGIITILTGQDGHIVKTYRYAGDLKYLLSTSVIMLVGQVILKSDDIVV